jgi:hypothetical protein
MHPKHLVASLLTLGLDCCTQSYVVENWKKSRITNYKVRERKEAHEAEKRFLGRELAKTCFTMTNGRQRLTRFSKAGEHQEKEMWDPETIPALLGLT